MISVQWKIYQNPSFVPTPGTASVLVQIHLVVPGKVSILGVQLVPARAWNDNDVFT